MMAIMRRVFGPDVTPGLIMVGAASTICLGLMCWVMWALWLMMGGH